MDIPTPDAVTITRSSMSGNTYTGPTTVASAVPCMIVPAGEDNSWTIGGRVDEGQIIMICDPTYEVLAGDTVTDDSTAEVYSVVKTQGPQRNPTDWTAHHQEVVMVQNAI